MPDCYDTSSLPQSLINAILEIWDTAGSDEQRLVGTERQEPRRHPQALQYTTGFFFEPEHTLKAKGGAVSSRSRSRGRVSTAKNL